MTPPEPDLNPISVLALALTAVFGAQVAQVASAYTVILFGWFGGCIVGALRMPEGPRFKLVAFVLVSFVFTMGLTVPLAEALAQYAPVLLPGDLAVNAKALLFPVAAAVPAIGHTWLDIGAWAIGLVRRRVESREGGPQ